MWPLPSDEGPHPIAREPGWEESWQFDFASPDDSLGGSVRLAVRADRGHAGRAWYWAHIVGRGRNLVAVRDHDVDPPRGRALELRASGLWAELTCETPLDHWSAGLEAMGVAFDHPGDAFGDERGQPVAVGLDLEWEGLGQCWSPDGDRDGYEQPCEVHGDVLVGNQRIAVDALGTRSHSWGAVDWWAGSWWRAHGHLDDGSTFFVHSRARRPAHGHEQPGMGWGPHAREEGAGCVPERNCGGAPPGTPARRPAHGHGTWLLPGGEPTSGDATIDLNGAEPMPVGGRLTIGGIRVEVMALAPAPVLIPGPDGHSARLWRAMCRFVAADGRRGAGWCERLGPPR